MKKKISFIGIGVIGASIASHLLKNNREITIFNRTKQKSIEFKEKYKELKVKIAESSLEAGENKDYIFSCVGNDDDLNEIYFSKNGFFEVIKEGTCIIDHTTSSEKFSKFCYKKFKKKKSFFLDCPVSGGEIGAKEGNLSIMVGGDAKVFKKVKNIFKLYSSSVVYMGGSGNGQLAKMVNQICIASLIQGLSEGLNFGKKKGLQLEPLLKAISKGAAQSWQMDNRAKTMWNNKFNFGFMNKLMVKDLNIIEECAKEAGIMIPITEEVLEFYKKLIQNSPNDDTSSLIRLLK